MLPRRAFLALVLVFALLTAGCGEFVADYYDLRVVESELVKRFGDAVDVDAIGGSKGATFMVWFVNSALNDDSPQQRQTRAAEAAKIVSKNYPRIHKITDIMVGFLRKKSRRDAFRNDQIVAMHMFDKNAQPLPGRSEDSATPFTHLQVTPTYSSSSDETDISTNGIQLEGEPGGLGITVLPFFKVPGSVQSGKRPAPKTVDLNFASYAKKPRFPQTVPISFIADKKEVLKTKGSFKGNDAQFCYLTIPYKAFREMVSGTELIIKLGDKEYPLTPSQLAAMYAMTEYVAE